MRSKITVIGEGSEVVKDEVSGGGRAEVTSGEGDLAGADAVVVLDGADVAAVARHVARRAPGAVLVLATADPAAATTAALAASLLPRSRVFGVARHDLGPVAEALLFDRAAQVRAAVLCRGELGIEDRVETVPAHVAAGGLRALG